jgi:hypothetical protein
VVKLNKHAVLAVLGVIIVVVYARALLPSGSDEDTNESDSPEAVRLVSTRSHAEDSGPLVDLPEGWGRNPFVSIEKDRDLQTVTMIAIGSDGVGSAMVDGHLVRAGQRIGNNRILSVAPGSVVVENRGRRYELHLRRESGL